MAKDTIVIDPPTTASTQEAVVVPGEDGVFVIRVKATHKANEKAPPRMSLLIKINDRVDYQSKDIGWQDGDNAQEATTTEEMKKGKEYRVLAQSLNANAQATGINMRIERTA